MNVYAQRVKDLRTLMKNYDIYAYVVLSADPHLSEYLPDYYKGRVFMSGFSGSVGTLVFTQDHAFLWVDGRYWLQAEKELNGSGIELQKQYANNTFLQWIKNNLSKNNKLAIDFSVTPIELQRELAKTTTLIYKDFLQDLWLDRPPLPKARIYEHEEKYCSFDRPSKLALVREQMSHLGAKNHLISSLDDIAWITNLRGDDVEFNPVFLSHLLMNDSETLLFVDKDKIDKGIEQRLLKDGIKLASYDTLLHELSLLKNTSLLIEPTRIVALAIDILHESVEIIESINPSTHLKAAKTKKEIAYIQEAMIEDGVALCRFFAWLENELKEGRQVSELDISSKLTEFRALSPYYVNDSFASIVGFGQNGALPHYKATNDSFAMLESGSLLLIDSGGQYKNGTTDITRVVPIGEVNSEQIHDYSLVLKAHIAISSTIFPSNIAMPLLDSITRAPLWQEQIDYIHGTGHGVGYFLNVHEGPQVLSYLAPVLEKTKAKEGMLTSIEPGIYKKGKWGVRLENLVAHTKVENPKNNDFGEFLCFKPLTLCPFEPSCIDKNMLDSKEIAWINNYHKEVFNKLAPKLQDPTSTNKKIDNAALEWLKTRTKAL